MKLSAYLLKTKTTEKVFASKVGTSQPHVNRLKRGRMVPSLELAIRIERETRGKVKPRDFIDEITEG